MTALLVALALLQGSVQMTTIDRGTMSGIDRPLQQIVRSADEWQALWTRHESNQPLPVVDFSKEMVAAVALGTRPTGGWTIDVVGAEPRGDGLVIRYVVRGPQPGQVAPMVITSPFHFVRLARSEGKVAFEKVDPGKQ